VAQKATFLWKRPLNGQARAALAGNYDGGGRRADRNEEAGSSMDNRCLLGMSRLLHLTGRCA